MEQKNKLYIKNMVCNRCIMVVREEFKKLGIEPIQVELGIVETATPLTAHQRESIKSALNPLGFELIDDKRIRIIEQVKNAIIELIYTKNGDLKVNLSDYLAAKVHHDYSYISNLFSEIENTTIEKYFIAQKTERVKELLVYDELSLSEIADLLNYSSTAHLSTQFKKVTGLTPSHFKKVKENKRKPLDQV
ncbi:AraC family transcriptional regulator [Bacteroides sp. 519]|uniref:helix-turn-helix domain-containing protein n=1 Tax=Bacteroides sp. 519 TaxID=2302937 RepID=UPI00194022C7|nr:AraC family transcriptional regulator [Bacteroides sp. 519]